MTDVYEFSEYDRHKLIYNFSTMTSAEIEAARAKVKQYEMEQAAKKAAAAAQAAAAKAAPQAPTASSAQSPAPPKNS